MTTWTTPASARGINELTVEIPDESALHHALAQIEVSITARDALHVAMLHAGECKNWVGFMNILEGVFNRYRGALVRQRVNREAAAAAARVIVVLYAEALCIEVRIRQAALDGLAQLIGELPSLDSCRPVTG